MIFRNIRWHILCHKFKVILFSTLNFTASVTAVKRAPVFSTYRVSTASATMPFRFITLQPASSTLSNSSFTTYVCTASYLGCATWTETVMAPTLGLWRRLTRVRIWLRPHWIHLEFPTYDWAFQPPQIKSWLCEMSTICSVTAGLSVVFHSKRKRKCDDVL